MSNPRRKDELDDEASQTPDAHDLPQADDEREPFPPVPWIERDYPVQPGSFYPW
jgi:hypothetical protein